MSLCSGSRRIDWSSGRSSTLLKTPHIPRCASPTRLNVLPMYALYYCSQHTMIDIAFVVQEACWLEDLTYAIPSEDLAETVPTSKRTELKVLWKVVP